MQPVTSCLVKNREDFCIYCSNSLKGSERIHEFQEGIEYKRIICPEGHVNLINKSRRDKENWSGLIRIILMGFPNRERTKAK